MKINLQVKDLDKLVRKGLFDTREIFIFTNETRSR